MLRRRRLEEPSTAAVADGAAPPLPPLEEVDVEALDLLGLWGEQQQGWAAGEEGDKGWLFTDEQAHWPFCAWEGTLTRNLSNIFALYVKLKQTMPPYIYLFYGRTHAVDADRSRGLDTSTNPSD
jgi:hypothetical protein